jgi:LysR family nitrogen assimilation transcriptional regulator
MVLSVPLAETVKHNHPKITLRLVEAMSGDIQTWVSENSIDIGFLYDIQQQRHHSSRPLFKEQLFFVAAPDNWSAPADRAISLAEAAKLPLVIPSRRHGLREMIERHARAANVALNVTLEIDALTQIKALVARASGYTILAHAAVLDEVERGDLILIPIEDPAMIRIVSLVRNPIRVVTRASLGVERIAVTLMPSWFVGDTWRAQAMINHRYSQVDASSRHSWTTKAQSI